MAALGASLALYWPGVATYDGVRQYEQILGGQYDDWHPPVMARLWAVLSPLGGGAAPMLVVQLATYWLGLALIGGALARGGRARAGLGLVAIGAVPVALAWQGVVLKDMQMTGALLAAVGIVAWWRLRGIRVPLMAIVAVMVLLAYATLVRANAVFATVPLVVMLAGAGWSLARRTLFAVAGVLAILAVSPVVNHAVLRGAPSGVERTQALYDLSGIAVQIGDPAATGMTAGEVAALRAKACVRAFFWDPLGDDAHCGPALARVRALPVGMLYATLARAAVAHPVAYATHRLAHLNSTERWLVPARWPSAAPPATSEANTLGLASPGAGARMVQRVAALLVETPVGWPFVWVVVALTLLGGLWRKAGTARDVAVALLASALMLEASFAVISIASDLRYHLWAMLATALAGVIGARVVDRRALVVGGAALAILLVPAVAARTVLAPPPQTYAGMLG